MKKRITKWLGITLGIVLVAAAALWAMFGTFIRAANSVKKLEDGLYTMEFTGDYGFDKFLAQGGAASDAEVENYLLWMLSHGFYKGTVQTGGYGCSTICTQDADGACYFGHNYDWAECQAMIVHTRPDDGYESISTCCLDFLGFAADYAPDGSMMERMQGIGSQQSHQRYDTLAAYTGPAGMSEVRGLLESVSQKNYPLTDGSYEKTMWSIVYYPEEHRADFYFRENYQRSYGLLLSEAIQENGQ